MKHDKLFGHGMRALPVSLALAVLPVPRALGDARAAVPFRVEFSSGKHCGTPANFSAELSKRSPHVRPALGGEPAFAFQIDVRENQETLEGRLTLREPSGRITVRVVPGATCSEVIPALAVIAAVLVEPGAVVEEPPSVTAPAALPARESSGWGVGASAGVVAQGAVAPRTRLGVGIEANVAFESGSFISPLFAVAYTKTQQGTADTGNGIAELNWWAIRASACPLRWPETGPVALRPCGLFDLGVLKGEGVQTYLPEETSITWVAPGASLRLDAGLFSWLWLTGEAGLLRPLNRDRFVFDPEPEVAYQPPRLGGFARLAVGGRFQ